MTLTGGYFFFRFKIFSYDTAIARLEQIAVRQKIEIDFFFQEKLKALQFLSKNFDPSQFKKSDFLSQKLAVLRQQYGDDFLNLEFLARTN